MLRNQVNDLKRQNDEYIDRLEKQHDELQRLNAKIKDVTLINKQLNDELNEKTEQICHLHSENSRCVLISWHSIFMSKYHLKWIHRLFSPYFIANFCRITIEITKLVNEMKNGQENESHLSLQLASERKATDSTSKSLTKCEELLKKITNKNELLGRENTSLADNVWDVID